MGLDPIDGFQSLFYDDEGNYKKIWQDYEQKYKAYAKNANEKEKKYMQLREDYNSEITIINNERLSMRMEIQRLYNFLKAVGGSMGARITPFDFEKEAPVYNEDIVLIEKLEKPELENWHYIDGVVRMSFVKGHNKAIIKDFEKEVQEQKIKYTYDLTKRDQKIEFVKDAEVIAKLYRDIVVIVRDTIRDKIIPEMGLIKSFLYADAIREKIMDGGKLDNIRIYSIEEYQGTTQDKHYQFIKNTVDFYNLIVKFFKEKILTQIIKDQKITPEEKSGLKKQIQLIEEHITLLEKEKVM